MRPIRITGITGTSPVIPLDTYCTSPATVSIESAAAGAQLQYTTDNVFDTAITPVWFNLGAAAAASPGVNAQAPSGARAVRCTGMISADFLSVSQQSIR
jgi:hypothetical protein